MEGDEEKDGDEGQEDPLPFSGIKGSHVVVAAVQGGWHDDSQKAEELGPDVFAQVGVAAGQAIEEPHEDAEAGMAWDGRYGPDQGGREAVDHDVGDIFPEGKAQGHEDSVDDPVVLAVEFLAEPGPTL